MANSIDEEMAALLQDLGEGEQQDDLSAALEVDDFVQRWGLQEVAQQMLTSMDPSTRQVVMSKFAPKTPSGSPATNAEEVGRDCNGKFIMFAKSFKVRNSSALDDFVARWGLEDVAQQKLAELDAVSQQVVMSQFAPMKPDGSPAANAAEVGRDCNGKFIMYASSFLANGCKGKGNGKGKDDSMGACANMFTAMSKGYADSWGWDGGASGSRKGADCEGKTSWKGGSWEGVAKGAGWKGWADDSWGCTGGKKGDTGKNGATQRWSQESKGASSWHSGGWGAGGKDALAAHKSANWAGSHNDSWGTNGGKGADQQMSREMFSFVKRWNLGDKAKELLLELDPASQQSVISQFAPMTPAGTPGTSAAEVGRDCNGKFIMFVSSFKDRGKGKMSQPGHLHVSLPAKQQKIEVKVPSVYSSKGAKGQGPATSKGVRVPGAGARYQEADPTSDFIARWGLEETAQRLLWDMDPPTQHAVMEKFAPMAPGGVPATSAAEVGRDCNGKFIMFANSFKLPGKGKAAGKTSAPAAFRPATARYSPY
eukprot:TRINITY_DN23927_c0_g1_i1.p1 TRINITY_DN23927_c0_g1~~TRINITY_DN23927_c0_g1_i1.p1  ORF type:complete len:537 (-),score=115.38 TRINITY_DN23927_c0_g1_i1:18-1628(-)